MLFKCKICGGDLNIQKGQSIVECEYCGVKQTLPRFLDENTKLMYDRANNYLLHNEFDKAENIYNQILLADREDADAYWSLVLCKYGITYVKDPKTNKYIPTCNRTYYSSIFDDENYKNALKYANEEKKALFEADAKTIDDIQHSIIAISRKEKPFDIFISYKETGANGGRTKDSIAAQDLYEKLTSEGYKVFFSRITLEDKIGTEYEPYIYAALASSKVMITVSSSKDNIESVWVKNEWSRFLAMARKDNTKIILPLYFDMNKTDLPDEFAYLPSYDMKAEGFEQDLIRGIKKLIPMPIMLMERRKAFRNRMKIVGIVALALAVIVEFASIPWFMKLPKYNAAMQLYYDKNYPEATWAFADLGSYRDSEEMKDKCERSWRNSLATVATDNDIGSSSAGSYYITPNGTVESFAYNKGNANESININEHGKITSISDNYMLYALHEDGYVENAVENNSLKNDLDWRDIIQISPVFNTTNIALKSNGTITLGQLTGDSNNSETDLWLEKVTTWDSIVGFDSYVSRYGTGKIIKAAVVGIKADGTLEAVVTNNDSMAKAITLTHEEILKKFNDVKSVDIFVDSNFNHLNFETITELEIVAVTNHGTIQTYIDGQYEEFEAPGLIDAVLVNDYNNGTSIYELHSDGNLYKHGESKYLLSDVVYVENNFAITRSGSIYRRNYDLLLQETEGKTKVHSEWLERMK